MLARKRKSNNLVLKAAGFELASVLLLAPPACEEPS